MPLCWCPLFLSLYSCYSFSHLWIHSKKAWMTLTNTTCIGPKRADPRVCTVYKVSMGLEASLFSRGYSGVGKLIFSVLGVLALSGRGSCKSNSMVMTTSSAGRCKLESPNCSCRSQESNQRNLHLRLFLMDEQLFTRQSAKCTSGMEIVQTTAWNCDRTTILN